MKNLKDMTDAELQSERAAAFTARDVERALAAHREFMSRARVATIVLKNALGRSRELGGLCCTICMEPLTPSEAVMANEKPYELIGFGIAHEDCAKEASREASMGHASDAYDYARFRS
jgi:hypothetical protein